MRNPTVKVIIAAILIAASAGAVRAGETTFAVVERATTNTIVDVGKPGDSEGDVLTFHNDLFDAENRIQVGRDNGWCVRTIPGEVWECVWTSILADGQITVEGPFLDKGDSLNAVTGGTGAYADVRGEMKLHARDEEGTGYDFVYRLTR
jgi:Allene oxide cyclase